MRNYDKTIVDILLFVLKAIATISFFALIVGIPLGLLYLCVRIVRLAWGN